jgi:hypothetical protein
MHLMRQEGTTLKKRNPSGFVESEPSEIPRFSGLSRVTGQAGWRGGVVRYQSLGDR